MANQLAPLYRTKGLITSVLYIREKSYQRSIKNTSESKKLRWWNFSAFLSYYNIIISEILEKIKFWDSKNFEVNKNLKIKENWSRIIIEVSEKRRKIDSGGWCVVKAE